MDSVKNILDQLYDFWKRRSTFKAFIFFILTTNFFLYSVFSLLYFFFNKLKLLESPNEFKNFIFILAGVYGLVNLLVILLWIYWRNVHQIPISGIGIIFAPHSDPECNNLIYKLYDQFKLDLEKRELTDQITYKILPENKIIRNHDDATNLLASTGARLVIHGFVQKGKIKGEHVEGFKTISFTLRHRTLHQAEKKPVMHALARALAYRTFTAREKNSFFEKYVVIENISEVSCFFISMGLVLDGKLESSREMLENLLVNIALKMKNPLRNPQLLLFHNAVVSILTVALHASIRYIYLSYLIENITIRSHDRYAKQCLEYLDRILSFNRKTSDYYLQKAILLFHFNDISGAFSAVKKAKKLAPTNSPGPHFSFAFLYLWNDDYIRALKEYRRAERCTISGVDFILDIILFLQSLYKNHPQKKQLLYALAFLNEKYFDRVQAIKDYQTFINEASPIHELAVLKAYAKKRLDLLKNSKA